MNYQGKSTFFQASTNPLFSQQNNFKGPNTSEHASKQTQFNFQPKNQSVTATTMFSNGSNFKSPSIPITVPQSNFSLMGPKALMENKEKPKSMPDQTNQFQCATCATKRWEVQDNDKENLSFKFELPDKSKRFKLEDAATRYVKNLYLAAVELDYQLILFDEKLEVFEPLDEYFNEIAIRSLWIIVEFENELALEEIKILLRTKLSTEFVPSSHRGLVEQIETDYRKIMKHYSKMEAKAKEDEESNSIQLCKPSCQPICEKCLNRIGQKSSKTEFRTLLHYQLLEIESQIKEFKPFVRPSVKLLQEKILAKQNLVKLFDLKITEIKKNPQCFIPGKLQDFHEVKCFKKDLGPNLGVHIEIMKNFCPSNKIKLLKKLKEDKLLEIKKCQKDIKTIENENNLMHDINIFFSRQRLNKLKKSKKVVMSKIEQFKKEEDFSEKSYLKDLNDRVILLKSNLQKCKKSNSLLRNIQMILLKDEIELLEKETKDFLKANKSSENINIVKTNHKVYNPPGWLKVLSRMI